MAEIYNKLGAKLIDAIVSEFREELDEIRTKMEMKPKTKDETEIKIAAKLTGIKDYGWMNESRLL